MRLSEHGSNDMPVVLCCKELALGGLNDIGGRDAFRFAGIRLSIHPNQRVRFSCENVKKFIKKGDTDNSLSVCRRSRRKPGVLSAIEEQLIEFRNINLRVEVNKYAKTSCGLKVMTTETLV